MRKLTGAVFVSLDGVMQAPGGPDEDPTSGFELGGWTHPFFTGDMGPFEGIISGEYDLLLGRRTYDIFSAYWPNNQDNEIGAKFQRIDVLVNNAGMISIGPFEHMREDDFRRSMAVNFYAALNTILAVLPGMRGRGEGRIVNITSIGGKVSVPHLLPYSTSKFALVGLSEGLRAELAKRGLGARAEPLPAGGPAPGRTPPAVWAAFALVGDPR